MKDNIMRFSRKKCPLCNISLIANNDGELCCPVLAGNLTYENTSHYTRCDKLYNGDYLNSVEIILPHYILDFERDTNKMIITALDQYGEETDMVAEISFRKLDFSNIDVLEKQLRLFMTFS